MTLHSPHIPHILHAHHQQGANLEEALCLSRSINIVLEAWGRGGGIYYRTFLKIMTRKDILNYLRA